MEFYWLKDAIETEWDELVYSSEDGWFTCLSIWQKMIAGIPEWGYKDLSFALYDKGKILALMPIQLTKNKQIVSTAMGAGGVVISSDIYGKFRAKIIRTILDNVKKIAKKYNVHSIEILVSPLNQTSLQNIRGINNLIHYEYKDVSTYTKILNLEYSRKKLWSDLSQDARQNIKKAEKSGYFVERSCWEDFIDDYYAIHQETYFRTGATPHPKSYFQGISQIIEQAGHSALWVGKDCKGKPVAFHNCARHGSGALYWTGCCKTESLNSGINYMLFWKAILGAKEDGYGWYEIGEVFPNVLDGKLKGLTVFKSKFGGELHRVLRSELSLIPQVDENQKKKTKKAVLRNWLRANKSVVELMLGEKMASSIANMVKQLHLKKRDK